MDFDLILRSDEKAVFALRELYSKYGYAQYTMSKFEEYDLYGKNKDFLVSENVITFTDTDGKLMALKPDVTLSIIKNNKDNPDGMLKVFYDENVYRVSKGTRSFKEIMQAGLECLGDVDDYTVLEVLSLAVKSLQSISNDFVLDVSSLDVIGCIMEELNLDAMQQKQVMLFMAEKNAKALEIFLENNCGYNELTNLLVYLVGIYGSPGKVRNAFSIASVSKKTLDALDRLCGFVSILQTIFGQDKIRIDFSVINNLNYYNGIVFNGFISGIPTGILSGGQYDNLMSKMGRKSKAIGFAVYLDELTKFSSSEQHMVDVAIEYGNASEEKVNATVRQLIDQGKSVVALKSVPEKMKYKQLIKIDGEAK